MGYERGRIRTHGARLRRPVQYPAMRRAQTPLMPCIEGGYALNKRQPDDLLGPHPSCSDAERRRWSQSPPAIWRQV